MASKHTLKTSITELKTVNVLINKQLIRINPILKNKQSNKLKITYYVYGTKN